MTGFSADWLALREPFDRAARAESADHLDWPALAARLHAGGKGITVLDLGCGTGASLREIAPRLGGTQHWRMVDHDRRLLDALPAALAPWASEQGLRMRADGVLLIIEGNGLHLVVERCQADLAQGLDTAPFDGAQLVTASALLDLVSQPWLAALVARCRAVGAAVCWALNVDERVDWQPGDAGDAQLLAQFQAHQQRDKGFGPALGGAAAPAARALLAQAGYQVAQAASDWRIDGAAGLVDQAMLRALIEGMAQAAIEQAPSQAQPLAAWQARRLAQIVGMHLCVGHVDLVGWL